ncbi:MAG: M14 family metallopeptidase [Candidatus Faecivicinus sp.]
MIEQVVKVNLPVDEEMRVQKMRLTPQTPRDGMRRISIVTGTHGDELEGQYVCYELQRRLRAHPELLNGIVDIYPALNPLGVDSITRGVPGFDLDMNRIFPGNEDGAMAEYAAAKITQDILGSDLCIDVHASNIFLREIPQVRVSEITAQRLLPYARQLNCDFIWVHASATVLESTLAHTLNTSGVPTLVVEMGVGMRITREYGDQLLDGIFRVMHNLGIWTGEAPEVRTPIVSTDGKVRFINAESLGMFVPRVTHWDNVHRDEVIGDLINPLTGEGVEVKSPCDGLLFTLREYPLVYEGSLVARVLSREEEKP